MLSLFMERSSGCCSTRAQLVQNQQSNLNAIPFSKREIRMGKKFDERKISVRHRASQNFEGEKHSTPRSNVAHIMSKLTK